MKRKSTGLWLALCLLLCGCGAQEKPSGAQTALDLRGKMLEGVCAYQAVLTAGYEEEVCEFTVQCECSARGGTDLTITAPGTLAGLCAHVDEAEAKIVFDGTEAAFGTLSSLSLSPMAAPQKMAEAWCEGYIEYTGEEDGMLRVSYLLGYGEQTLGVDTWLKDGAPVRAELSSGGECFLWAEISRFSILPAPENQAAPGAA